MLVVVREHAKAPQALHGPHARAGQLASSSKAAFRMRAIAARAMAPGAPAAHQTSHSGIAANQSMSNSLRCHTLTTHCKQAHVRLVVVGQRARSSARTTFGGRTFPTTGATR